MNGTTSLVVFFCIALSYSAFGIQTDVLESKLKENFGNLLVKSCYLTPCSIRGDFDGDKKLDDALLVASSKGKKKGIAILHATGKPKIVGAGIEIGNGGDDFGWMDRWSLYKQGTVSQGVSAGTPPKLRGDALLVEKTEAASALIYWKKGSYVWYQQGD